MGRTHTDWWKAVRELPPAHRYVVTAAVLFCFYDGSESSPDLSTLQDAWAFAQASGFAKDAHDGSQD